MFTGLTEEIGIIESVLKSEKSAKITVRCKKVLEDIKLGDSICTNGVCLTVVSYENQKFSVDVMAETMRRSNLKYLLPGNEVNLERALRIGDRIGGHFVSGHIDGEGTIENFKTEDNAVWVTVSAEASVLKYIIKKGSIAVDGVSLTVADVNEKIFKVSVIPHTKAETTLLRKKIGSRVNLECDMIGKYVEKLFKAEDKHQKGKEKIDLVFLSNNGFI